MENSSGNSSLTLDSSAPHRNWLGQWRQRLFRHAPTDATAVVLRHSRIYLLPTRRGWAVIATLVTMLLASLNYALALGVGRHVPADRPRRRGAAAHVPEPGRHRDHAACRRRDVRGRSPAVHARAARGFGRAQRHHGGDRACAGRRRHRRRRRADRHARRPRAPAGTRGARTRDADVRPSVRALARLGVRPLPARGHRVSGARRSGRRRCRAASAAPTRSRRDRATTPTWRACASTSAAIRRSASHGRPSRAAAAGTRRSSTAPAAAARSRSRGTRRRRRCPSSRACRG